MAKRVFFCFHYQDVIDFRANVVRNHWMTKPDRESAGFFDASVWESTKKTGDVALKRLINGALEGTTVTCVLIGSSTYDRRWVRYEVIKSIERGNRLFGVHINSIKDKNQQVKIKGTDPFDYLALKFSQDGEGLSFHEYRGSWIDYTDVEGYALKKPAEPAQRGQWQKLSQRGYLMKDWVADNGYGNFSSWVG